MAVLDAIVVVPARDEEARIADCIRALGAQTTAAAFAVIVVCDACRDRTADVAARTAGELGLALTLIDGPGRGTGPARRAGMELACERLLALDRAEGLIATTDADSTPARDWLERQLAHRDAGASVIAGRIELDAAEASGLPDGVLDRRRRDAATRLSRVRVLEPDAGHHHFAGASLAVTAATYRAVGGLEPRESLEDDGFGERLARHRVPVLRAADVVVTTSARIDGRARQGLSVDLAVSQWFSRRRYDATAFTLARLANEVRAQTVTVIVCVQDGAAVGGVLEVAVRPAVAAGLVDEVVVVAPAGVAVTPDVDARVVVADAIAGELGPALGRGDAMWRALQVSGGEIVCFLDGDAHDPDPSDVAGLIGPLLHDRSLALVKGAVERHPEGHTGSAIELGDRVTELTARPLLNRHAPLLAGFSAPLSRLFAARRDVLEQLAFPVGEGVEIAILLDAFELCGLDALAETDLGMRPSGRRALRGLGEAASAVLAAVERRAASRGADTAHATATTRLVRPWDDGAAVAVSILERPPIVSDAGGGYRMEMKALN
jgi:glucosyl-3-phosphoglycerate synthase